MKPAYLPDHAGWVRQLLTDPRLVCERLAILERAVRQGNGLLVNCPWHAERTPSCSVTRGRDGTIRVHCFGCDATGDVLHLVAAVYGIDIDRDFPRVLELAAQLAGVTLDEPQPPRPAPPPPEPERSPPPRESLTALQAICRPVLDDSEVSGWLRSRALEPGDVELRDLARALPAAGPLPAWARTRWGTWAQSGHRLVIPMYDETGNLVNLRGRRVSESEPDRPKELTPTGYRSAGVMACSLGRQILSTGRRPEIWPDGAPLRVVVAEGTPDFLTWATSCSEGDVAAHATIAIAGGGRRGTWTDAIASRIPDGSRVIVHVDHDEAGERYAEAIVETLRGRHLVLLRGGSHGCPRCSARSQGAS